MKVKTQTENLPSPFKRVLPGALKTGKDHLLLRIDFYSEAIVMEDFDKKGGRFRMVSPQDITRTLSSGLSYASGLLPENTLWWSSSGNKPVVALWVEPGIRRLALQLDAMKAPVRYDVPLPGLIFLCRPGAPPHVYAATKRPEGPRAQVFKAPLANVYDDGRSCPGSNRYPADIANIPDSFFKSFFTRGANLNNRSKKHSKDITELWKELDKKDKYPLDDLVYHGTVNDLMSMRI